MAINKDVILATVILVVCGILLSVAFSDPAIESDGDGGRLASATPTRPSRTPDLPDSSLPERSKPAAPTRPMAPEPEPKSTTRPAPEPARPEPDVRTDPTPAPEKPVPEKPAVRDGSANLLALLQRSDPIDDYRRDQDSRSPQSRQEPVPIAARESEPQRERTQAPQRPAAEPEQPETAGRRYVVQSGDTLGAISRRFYGSSRHWRRIQQANAIDDPAALREGQQLRIPDADTASAASGGRTSAPIADDGRRRYTVQTGDSYYVIAQRELGDAGRWPELEDLNEVPSESLHVGQEIVLPERGRSGSAARPDASTRKAPSDAVVHVVGKGEILGEISRRYYGTSRRWRDIAEANDITDPAQLKAGQRLIIPGAGSDGANAATSRPQSSATGTDGNGRTYRVQSGDTLAGIAKRFYGAENAYRRIIDANPGINPRRLSVGQQLRLPGLEDARAGQQAEPQPQRTAPSPSPREREEDEEDTGPSSLQQLLRRAQGEP